MSRIFCNLIYLSYLCHENQTIMNNKLTISVLLMAALAFGLPTKAQTASVPNPSYTGKGNPILPDFHADPEVLYSNKTKRYYIYSTTDGQPGGEDGSIIAFLPRI